ncbi:MAG TPA: HD domain-containing protein [Geobacteraceae bacterium]|nr:HD domain-containing protein [Geobacteraceae bacterium]
MEKSHLQLLREWFAGFAGSFQSPDGEEQRNIALKEEHTQKVCANITRIAREEGLDGDRAALAEAVALFHDVGRFPQYRRYKTFKDSASVNHAQLGAGILVVGGVLDKLPRNEQITIITGVRNHNAFAIPPGLEPDVALFLKLVRDADKLDIWRVFLEFYGLPEEERASAVSLGFPDQPGCSPEVLSALRRGEIVQLASVRSLNDFKLLQLSWVNDLNFAASFRMIDERDYINRLAGTLPDDEDIQRAIAVVKEYVSCRTGPGTGGTRQTA